MAKGTVPAQKPERLTDEQVTAAADVLIRWVASISQQYRDNIEIARSENGWDSRTMFGAWIGYVLENDLHLQVPSNPFFEPSFSGDAGGQSICICCKSDFLIQWPGQRTCCNECSRTAKEVLEGRRLTAAQAMALEAEVDEAKTPL